MLIHPTPVFVNSKPFQNNLIYFERQRHWVGMWVANEISSKIRPKKIRFMDNEKINQVTNILCSTCCYF